MKRLIIITLLLLIATVLITVVYFKNLNQNGLHTSQVMHTIPDNAAIIFQFNNDKSFYDIFNDNQLFTNLIGKQTITNFDTLRNKLLLNPALEPFFSGKDVFISLHPLKNNIIELLLTTSAGINFSQSVIEQLAKQPNSGLIISPFNIAGQKSYTIYINSLKKTFYLVNKEDGIFSGSFSKDLIEQCAQYHSNKAKQNFILLPDQQNSNSLANLYINYSRLPPLFEQLFKNKNTDIFKSFKLLPALAVLSLNFKSDALMFNGFSNIQKNGAINYLCLFTQQQPVENHLKDIFPSTTAYSISFAVSNPIKFQSDLAQWYKKAGLKNEKDSLFNKIKKETGINLINEFNSLLSTEFAVVTTRYQEKFAIIALKDGSKLKPFMYNMSTMVNDNMGQLNYNKLPCFLLGDAFSQFNHPWFMIIDNYLILANSTTELASYYDTYINRKFQSKMKQYNQFDDLLNERSNVTCYINFKNAQPILQKDLNINFYSTFENTTGWNNFYAASYQLIAANKNFYTGFYMKLNTDSTLIKK